MEAAKAIIKIYEQDFQQVLKQDGSPVTEADHAASACIHKILEPLGIPITGEESEKAPYEVRQKWNKSWCIDPLDGTKEFIKRNGEFAVNIALIENGQPIFGLIASPLQEEILLGSKETGVFKFYFKDWQSQEKFDLIVSNPPYIPQEEAIQMQPNVLDYEPHMALFVPNEDPLRFYKQILLIAFAAFQERELGTLEKGKDATFAIFEYPVDGQVGQVQNYAWRTFIKGKCVFKLEAL